ncbi:MAG: ADP-ribose pyrophosphatase [Acidobacteriota bacterium]
MEIDGKIYLREVVRHPGGVVILALLPDGRIPFVKQHRYPLGEELLELPAGKLDHPERPEVCAARELEEETGLRPIAIRHVCSFYTSPGFCDELLHFYFAPQVEKTEAQPEADEDVTVELYTLDEALYLVEKGALRDGKTILALLWLALQRQAEATEGDAATVSPDSGPE